VKILGPRGHGYVDYLIVLGFLAAPQLLDFPVAPQIACYAVGCLHLLVTAGTAAPFGLLRAIPFPLHGILEFAVSIVLVATPWLLGMSADAGVRNFFVGSGLFVLSTFLVSDYPPVVPEPKRRRSRQAA
jgi:hypothetical protein